MKYSDFMVWADDLIQIYLRCGPRPFTHAEISDITHRGTAEHERLEADLGWNRDLPDVLWRSPEWRSGGEDLEERS